MKKRGNIFVIFFVLLAVIVLIFFFVKSVFEVEEKSASVEIINLKTSLQTKILQQSERTIESRINVSFAVPSSVSKICFFDSNKKYEPIKNADIIGLYSEDKQHNLFILTDQGFFPYKLNNLNIPENQNPLCVKIQNNKIILQFTTGEKGTIIEGGAETESVKCSTILSNGKQEKKIDIVFLGYGFLSSDEYNKEINRYVNNILLEFAPLAKYKDKFNFYRIDDAKIECNINDFIQCDEYQLKISASDCPHDYIVLLVDRNVLKDYIKPVRSSSLSNIAKINTADRPFVLVHEFGHIFADLADEYVDESYYTLSNFDVDDYTNCDYSPCTSWSNVKGTGCYEGCSLKKYFRPTEDSIMRSLTSPTFGALNEREILKRLLYYE